MILLCTFTIRNIQDLSSNKTVIMIQAGGGLGWGTRLWYICSHFKFAGVSKVGGRHIPPAIKCLEPPTLTVFNISKTHK